MSISQYDTRDRDRPQIVWLIQCVLLFVFLSVLSSIWHSSQFCANSEVVENCWPVWFVPRLVVSLIEIGACIKLSYGLERGRPYARWFTGILFVAWVAISANQIDYTQMVLNSLRPNYSLPSAPYECWQTELTSNRAIFCGYNSYAELTKKVLMEIAVLLLAAIPGLWLLTSRAAKRYFTNKAR